jgi:hypothetical protein
MTLHHAAAKSGTRRDATGVCVVQFREFAGQGRVSAHVLVTSVAVSNPASPARKNAELAKAADSAFSFRAIFGPRTSVGDSSGNG